MDLQSPSKKAMKLTPLEEFVVNADKPGLAPKILGLVIILACLAVALAVLVCWT